MKEKGLKSWFSIKFKAQSKEKGGVVKNSGLKKSNEAKGSMRKISSGVESKWVFSKGGSLRKKQSDSEQGLSEALCTF